MSAVQCGGGAGCVSECIGVVNGGLIAGGFGIGVIESGRVGCSVRISTLSAGSGFSSGCWNPGGTSSASLSASFTSCIVDRDPVAPRTLFLTINVVKWKEIN